MLKKVNLTLILVAVVATFLGGCRSTKEYQQLAKAGTEYTTAMDSLLTSAGNIKLNATSEQLLSDDKINNVSESQYKNLSQPDLDRLTLLKQLRKHNQLLSRYFILLNEVATSSTPQDAQKEIGEVADNLSKIGNEIRLSHIVTDKTVFQTGGNIIISSQIRGALRKELEKRKDTIEREFLTQKALLKMLGDSIKTDINITIHSQETRLVIRPLTAGNPIQDEDQWIANRRKILTMDTAVSELNASEGAADKFREIFKDFVEGKLNRERFNTLLSDIESFLTFAEQLKKQ